MALTPKQQKFVDEFLVDLNATQAAIRAGYSEKTAGQTSHEYLRKPEIATAIQVAMDERAKRVGITADYVLETIVDTVERCKQAKPVRYKNGEFVFVETPDGETVPAYTFEANAVLKGSELLGKHLKMFTDKTELTGPGGTPLDVNWTTNVIKVK